MTPILPRQTIAGVLMSAVGHGSTIDMGLRRRAAPSRCEVESPSRVRQPWQRRQPQRHQQLHCGDRVDRFRRDLPPDKRQRHPKRDHPDGHQPDTPKHTHNPLQRALPTTGPQENAARRSVPMSRCSTHPNLAPPATLGNPILAFVTRPLDGYRPSQCSWLVR